MTEVRRLYFGGGALIGTCAALGAVERVAFVAVAFELPQGSREGAIVAAAAVALVAIAARALRGVSVRRARAALVGEIVRCLLVEGVALGAPLEDGDPLGTALQGLYVGPQIVAETIPAFVACVVAAAIATPFLAWHLPMRVVLVGGCSMALALVVTGGATAATARWAAVSQRAFAAVQSDLAAALEGRLDLVASGRDNEFKRRVRTDVATWKREATRDTLRMALAGRAPVLAALAVAALAVLTDSALRGALTQTVLGDLLVLAAMAPTLAGLLRGPFDLARGLAELRPLFALLGPAEASQEAAAGAPVPSLPASIEWRNVCFAYPTQDGKAQPVLRDFTALWSPDTVLGFEGPNGAGKSTLFRLLLGLGDPDAGQITVGGIDLSDLDRRAWRRAVGYLPQRPFLPEGSTVSEAVRLLSPDADDVSIRTALSRVDLWSVLVARQPGDPLGIRVDTLSAGQRQRLALARVLCQNARVVVLDEPDANLDRAGIALVARLVRELASDRMVAFAAHTPDLLQQADRVIVLAPSARGAQASATPLRTVQAG